MSCRREAVFEALQAHLRAADAKLMFFSPSGMAFAKQADAPFLSVGARADTGRSEIGSKRGARRAVEPAVALGAGVCLGVGASIHDADGDARTRHPAVPRPGQCAHRPRHADGSAPDLLRCRVRLRHVRPRAGLQLFALIRPLCAAPSPSTAGTHRPRAPTPFSKLDRSTRQSSPSDGRGRQAGIYTAMPIWAILRRVTTVASVCEQRSHTCSHQPRT
jgi:hypothetical protein